MADDANSRQKFLPPSAAAASRQPPAAACVAFRRTRLPPSRARRARRELTRDHTTWLPARAVELNRIPQTRDGANIQVAAVATDVLGVWGGGGGGGGGAMLEAIGAGTTARPIP